MSLARSGWRIGLLGAALLCLSLATAAPSRASGDALTKALERFATDSFSDTVAGIEAVTAAGSPRAGAILSALADGRLLIAKDGRIVLKDDGGRIVDAATGAAIDPPLAETRPIRLNNRVRGAVQAALGALALLNPDPGQRRVSALAILKSRDASKLAALETVLAKEPMGAPRQAMEAARAAINLTRADATEISRLEAVAVLKAHGDLDALAALKSIPATAPQAVRDLTQGAITSIEGRLALWGVGQNLVYGLSLGSVLLLAAIGLAITFGVMGVINMAHGEMVMIGAYTTFAVQQIILALAPAFIDASLLIALPAAFLTAALVGAAIERGVIAFLYGRPLETLLATWGVSLILQQAVRTLFGPTNQEVRTPAFMTGTFDQLGGLTLTVNRLIIIAFAIIVFATLLVALKRTALGLRMRAVTQNRPMAANMGIPTARVDAMTFALGSGIAGLAGVALSQIDNVSPNLGQGYIIDSFLVVVFGGVGNLWGTLIGALSLGVANKLLEPYAGAVLGKIALLVAVIIFIQKRPRGLFALKGRAVEA